jgi:hypothetical protein
LKKILSLLAICACLLAQNPATISDIPGDGAAHAVAATGTARWITFISPPSNSTTNCGTSAISGCVRIGDSNISTSRGTILQPGSSGFMLESSGTIRYDLSKWYYLAQSGDKVIITYGQ